jgi:hypothetical protein
VDKENIIYIYIYIYIYAMEYYKHIRKMKLCHCREMDGTGDHHVE